jgi:AcrR family transcriptional regulator
MPRLTAVRRRALDEMMKEAIFEATVAVLAEHQIEGMTMDRVASAAGVAKGSLYNYFSSKKELLEFVYAKLVDPTFKELAETVASDRPAIEKLSTHVRNMLGHFAKHARVCKLVFEDDAVFGLLQSTHRSTQKAGSQRLAEIFRQGIAEGVFRPADPAGLALIYLGLCKGVFDSQPDLTQPDQRDLAHRMIVGTLLNGITTEKGRND